jgi:hypothetical protein
MVLDFQGSLHFSQSYNQENSFVVPLLISSIRSYSDPFQKKVLKDIMQTLSHNEHTTNPSGGEIGRPFFKGLSSLHVLSV